jgi:hypothetical protein
MSRFITVILLLLGLCTSAQRKFEIWNKNQLTTLLNEQVSFIVAEKIHVVPSDSRLEVAYGEAYVGHQVKRWLEYGIGFRVAKSQPLRDTWISENRTIVFADLTKPVENYEISLSNRMEYRSFKELDNYFRYRQALKLQFPELVPWGMRFYVSEEAFVKLNNGGFHLLRFYGGIDAFTGKNFKLAAYYALQERKLLRDWIASDIIGINLTFSI